MKWLFSRFEPVLPRWGGALSLCFLLSACVSSKMQSDMDMDNRMASTRLVSSGLSTDNPARLQGSAEQVDARAQSQRAKLLLRHTDAPYFAGTLVPATANDVAPKILDTPYPFNFGSGRVNLATVAARLSKLSGLVVRIRPDVYTQTASASASVPLRQQNLSAMSQPGGMSASSLPTGMGAGFPNTGQFRPPVPAPGGQALVPGPAGQAAVPAMGQPAPSQGAAVSVMNLSPASQQGFQGASEAMTLDAIAMQWKGTLREFLDHLTGVLSLSWEYRENAIVISRILTQSYSIATIPGNQKFSMSAGGAGSGSGGGQNSSSSLQSSSQLSESGGSDALKAIVETVTKMTQTVPGSSVVLNEQNGSLVVMTSKDVHAQIRDYIDAENRSLRQTVSITFDIYSVKTGEQQQQGFNLSGLKGIFSMSGPTTLVDGTSGSFKLMRGDNQAVLNLLQTLGRSVQHRPVSVITQNGRWDTKTRLSTIAYLKETTPGLASPTGVAGAPGLKTDTLTIGDQYAVLPIVLPDGTIFVKYNIILSDLVGMFEVSAGSGTSLQKVQTPKTDSVSASSTLHLASGETAVITGLSRIVAGDDQTRLGQDVPILFGGSNKARLEREHFLILIRATLL